MGAVSSRLQRDSNDTLSLRRLSPIKMDPEESLDSIRMGFHVDLFGSFTTISTFKRLHQCLGSDPDRKHWAQFYSSETDPERDKLSLRSHMLLECVGTF